MTWLSAALRRISLAANGCAPIVFLAAGVFALLALTRWHSLKSWADLHPFLDVSPQPLTVTVLVVALFLGLPPVLFRWGRAVTIALAIAGGLSLVVGSAPWADRGAHWYDRVPADFPLNIGMLFVVAAWVLALAGCLAVLVGAWTVAEVRPVKQNIRSRSLLLGVAVGVVVVALVTVDTVRTIRASNEVDASAAAETSVPPVPATLGQPTFTLTVPRAEPAARFGGTQVVAAGAGFVVREQQGVRAYDASGTERWHYLYTGRPAAAADLVRAFDDARTVAVRFGGAKGKLVALDAMTGSPLWSTTDAGIVQDFDIDADRETRPPLFLVRRTDSDWTRIDTRTGAAMWTVPAPPVAQRHSIDVADGPAYFTSETAGPQVRIRFVLLDPATGDTKSDRVVEEFPGGPQAAALTAAGAFHQARAGRNGVVFRRQSMDNGPVPPQWYIRTDTDAVVPVDGFVMATSVIDDSFLTRSSDRRVELHDGAAVRCVLPSDVLAVRGAWLRDQLVTEAGLGLIAVDRADCAAVPGTRIDNVARGVFQLISAPGLVVTAAFGDGRGYLITGFGT